MSDNVTTAVMDPQARVIREIKVLLIRRDMNQTDLADRIGVKQAYMSRRMTGEIPFDVYELQNIAVALGVSIRDLFSDDDEPSDIRPRRTYTDRPGGRRRKGGTMLPSSHATHRAARIAHTAHTPVAIPAADYAPTRTSTRTHGPRTARPIWRHA